MESRETHVSGGGCTTSVADLPADWRRQMDDELRNKLKELDADTNMQPDELTANDAVGIWRNSYKGKKTYLIKLATEGSVTMRTAYDPRAQLRVNVYKKV